MERDGFFLKDNKMSEEIRVMRPEDGWPISHTNSADTITKLANSPGPNQSWYITGFILTRGGSADGFKFLRRAALKLDSGDDNVTVPEDSALEPGTGNFAIEFGIKTTDVTLASFISKMDSDNGYNIEVLSTGQLKVTFGDGTSAHAAEITSQPRVNDGNWHHVIVNWEYQAADEEGLTLIIDGKSAADAVDNTATGSVTGGSGNLIIAGTGSKVGYISTLGLYSQILSAAEIVARWANGAGSKFTGDETGLSAAWNLDESSGHTLTHLDLVGSNDGTSSNSITWDDGAGFPIDPHTLKTTINYTTGLLKGTSGVIPTTIFNLPHAIKIGRNNPIQIDESGTSGWGLELYGFQSIY